MHSHLATFFAFLIPELAHAYVDPGTGAYLVQAFLAIMAAAAFYLRHPIEAVKRLIRKIFGKK